MAFADAQSRCVIYEGGVPAVVPLGATVYRGDILGESNGVWVPALATVGSVVQARCVAGQDGVAGQYITVYFGRCLIGGNRFSGATPGGALYVAEGSSNGKYTQTAPTTTGDANKIIGYALDEITLAISANMNVDSIA